MQLALTLVKKAGLKGRLVPWPCLRFILSKDLGNLGKQLFFSAK
jgi:hypothetical protein